MLQGGWPWPGPWSSAEHSPQAVPWDPQIIQQPKAGLAGGPPQAKAGVCLLPHSPPDDHHSPNCWLNPPLTVVHLQLVACGRGPLWGQPMAEQDRYLFGGGGVWCEAVMELSDSQVLRAVLHSSVTVSNC